MCSEEISVEDEVITEEITEDETSVDLDAIDEVEVEI
jgi:hypothetical protein